MPQVERFYARQSRLIDEGDAHGWAATFTHDGVFDSPSYPQPATGTDELVGFARGFHDSCVASATRMRHIVTNVDVVGDELRDDTLTVHAYLQIVATPAGEDSRLVRLTTLTDELVRAGGTWLVEHRRVRRDDVAPTHADHSESPHTAEGAPA